MTSRGFAVRAKRKAAFVFTGSEESLPSEVSQNGLLESSLHAFIILRGSKELLCSLVIIIYCWSNPGAALISEVATRGKRHQ